VRIYSGADLQWCGLAGTPTCRIYIMYNNNNNNNKNLLLQPYRCWASHRRLIAIIMAIGAKKRPNKAPSAAPSIP
jgi:hypothetical protein